MKPAIAPIWSRLGAAAETLRGRHLRDLFAADDGRFTALSTSWQGWLLDYSKQRIDADAMSLLTDLWRAADLPIVLMTGYATDENALLGEQCGATAFLPKPFDDVELLDQVRRVLESSDDVGKGGRS